MEAVALGVHEGPRNQGQVMSGWYTGQGGNLGCPGGVGIHGVTQTKERSEWANSTDMATTMWATRRADGLKFPSKTEGYVDLRRNVL